MLLRRVVVCLAAVLLLAPFAYSQTADFSGTWTGNVSGPLSCASGTITQTFSLNLAIQQSGSSASGTGSLTGPHDACVGPTPTETDTFAFSNGSVSGSSLNATVIVQTPSGAIPVQVMATLTSSSAMNISISAPSFGVSLSGTLTLGAAPSTDLTGAWSGTFNANDTCGGGNVPEHPIQWSSPATLVLVQQQASVSGAIIVYAVPDHGDQCQVVSTFPFVLPLSGQLSGSTLSGTVTTPGDSASVTGTVSGSSLSLNLAENGFSATASLTRGSSQMPDTHLSGSYSGSYSSVFIPCVGSPGQLPPITLNGGISGSLSQIGQALVGTLTVTGMKNDHSDSTGKCTVTDDAPGTVTMSGQISGNSLSGVVFEGNKDGNSNGGKVHPFSATISGNTITGFSPSDKGEDFTFTITRSGAQSAPPQILSFIATPRSIRAGQSATLSWSTDAATSVTIDNGVGSKPSSGSLTVTPSATTTYTLTATQGTSQTTATVTVTVETSPIVNVTELPAPMLQAANSGGATTSYALTNSGGSSTTITLTQTGSFFNQSPTSFSLAPGATQVITITGIAQPGGSYEGTSNVSGNGVPSNLQIPVKLLSAVPPTGTVTADPNANRVDVAAAGATNPSGTVSFTNHGNATLTGIVTSDVPWIIPRPPTTITIAPGATVTITFDIDRTKRPDSTSLVGSAEGGLSLTFLSGTGQSFAKRPFDTTTTIPSVSLVKVVDTVQTTITIAGVPAIGTGEVALFVAGVGHITGTGSKAPLFVSDVSLLNPQGSKSIDDVKFYYTPTTGSPTSAKSTSIPSVPGQVSVALGDVVKSIFSGNEEIGTLHIRSKDTDKLAVAATVLTTNNPTGSFGNTIPVFRSDRSVASGSALVLTGVRKDATTHTNLYIQETAGAPATVKIDFLAADGSTISSRTDSIDAFKLLASPTLFNVVPANAVAAIITNTSTAGGKISAYATPVDEASTDTWAVADWSSQLGYAPTDATIIPIAGSVHGANSTFYRTDLAITNRGTVTASATLRYVSRSGEQIDRTITLDGGHSNIISDVIGSLFGVSGDTTGYLLFTPVGGNFAVSSRTFTTVGGKPDTFGTGVPALAAASALRAGGARPIAGLADASRNTVVTGKPGTFRTNFALMETSGSPVTVRVTFRFTFPAGQKAQGIGAASKDYALNGNGFLLLNSIAGEILGPARLQFGDLTNVEADFQVISGGGSVLMFTSSVDNATGDSILRTE